MKILGAVTQSRRTEVIRELDQGAAARRDYALLVFLSCVIATAPTPTRTPTPTLSPTPTATPVSYAWIGGTNLGAANLRRSPGLTAVVGTIRDGTIVELTGRRGEADGLTWVEVVTPGGLVGWVADLYVVPYQPYREP